MTPSRLPATTWPFLGNEALGRYLIESLASDTCPTVMLWSGPAHVGKRSAALWLVQRSWCQAPGKPCGTCTTCRQVADGVFPEVTVIDAANDHGSLADVRALQSSTMFVLHDTRILWVLLPDVDQLSEGAMNALLKMLEEPPRGVRFVLTTSAPDRVLPTIRSRAAQFVWRTIPTAELESAIKSRVPTSRQKEAHLIAAWAKGRPGLALMAIADSGVLDQAETAARWLRGDAQAVSTVVDGIELAVEWVRDGVLAAYGATSRLRFAGDVTLPDGAPHDAWVARWKRMLATSTEQQHHVSDSMIIHDYAMD